jgi:hypothetical protein
MRLPRERAVGIALAGEQRLRLLLDPVIADLNDPYPRVRFYAKDAIERSVGEPVPVDAHEPGADLARDGRRDVRLDGRYPAPMMGCARRIIGSVAIGGIIIACSSSSTNPEEAASGGSGATVDGSTGGSVAKGGSNAGGSAGVVGVAGSAPDACVPATCTSLGAECGTIDDGCGATAECGTCPSGQTCGTTSPNKCGVGVCDPTACGKNGGECVGQSCCQKPTCAPYACGLAASPCGATTICSCPPPGTGNATWACVNDKCEVTCPAGYADCDHDPSSGCEANLMTDTMNCGQCGFQCAGNTAACSAGSCECTPPYALCYPGPLYVQCVDLTTDQHCGSCTNDCTQHSTTCSCNGGPTTCVCK